jgi:hypothetical protein
MIVMYYNKLLNIQHLSQMWLVYLLGGNGDDLHLALNIGHQSNFFSEKPGFSEGFWWFSQQNPAFGESIEIMNWLLPELGVDQQ